MRGHESKTSNSEELTKIAFPPVLPLLAIFSLYDYVSHHRSALKSLPYKAVQILIFPSWATVGKVVLPFWCANRSLGIQFQKIVTLLWYFKFRHADNARRRFWCQRSNWLSTSSVVTFPLGRKCASNIRMSLQDSIGTVLLNSIRYRVMNNLDKLGVSPLGLS